MSEIIEIIEIFETVVSVVHGAPAGQVRSATRRRDACATACPQSQVGEISSHPGALIARFGAKVGADG